MLTLSVLDDQAQGKCCLGGKGTAGILLKIEGGEAVFVSERKLSDLIRYEMAKRKKPDARPTLAVAK